MGHLSEVFIAQTAEEEGAGLGFREVSDGGTEGPGSGRVVGYIEEETGAFGEGEEFEAAWPFGVANARFYCGVVDFVTYFVTCRLNLPFIVTILVT